MSRKIYGITVGSPLPKSNLKQEDPSKGDFVKGKEIIPTKVSDLENDSKFLTESDLQEAIEQALALAKASGEFDGPKGDPGKTPVKGTDYFTEAEKTEMINRVIAALNNWDEVSF